MKSNSFALWIANMSIFCKIVVNKLLIAVFAGTALILESLALFNDEQWNSLLDNALLRFTYEQFRKCNVYYTNSSNLSTYEHVFLSQKRDLAYEYVFYLTTAISFLANIFVLILYTWVATPKGGIWLCALWNFVATNVYGLNFLLMLMSTNIYSGRLNNYQGSPNCYNFICRGDCENSFQRARAKLLHEEARTCFQDLYVCQLGDLKDRNVYLIFGCFVSSFYVLIVSCCYLRKARLCREQNSSKSKVVKLLQDERPCTGPISSYPHEAWVS